MTTPVAQWTTVLQRGGLTRARSGWHASPADAWAAMTAALAPHLARCADRAALPAS